MGEPFITLLPENSSDSNSLESLGDSTQLSTPPSATHDTRRASFHVRDLETFAKDLQNAADRAFPNEGRMQTRYDDVSVMLLMWEDDEMNVEWELDDLEKVFMKYGFNTERWLIPRKNAHLKLMSKAIDVVEHHEQDNAREDLVIVYYAGHAFINNARQATWCCKRDPSYASLEWSAIQTLFEKAHFDVLLLLDCCAAASAAPSIGSAVTETIAACGFENIAPEPGRYSFTNALIEVLEDWIDSPPFSAAMLHNKVLSVLKHERPERAQNGNRRRLEFRRTPIHIIATSNPRLPSIELGRRVPPKEKFQGSAEEQTTNVLENLPSSSIDLQSTSAVNKSEGSNSRKRKQLHPESQSLMDFESTSARNEPESSNSRKRKQLRPEYQSPMDLVGTSVRNELMPFHPELFEKINDEDYQIPRVIISLALERHQTLSSDSCQKWLASCPALVKFAEVEAVYKGFSVLLILTIPISLWDLLPEDPACCFIGFATSQNLLRCRPKTLESMLESSPLPNQIPTDSSDFTPLDDKSIEYLKDKTSLTWEQIHMNKKSISRAGSREDRGGSDIMKQAELYSYPSWSPESTNDEPSLGEPTNFLSSASSQDIMISNTEEATISSSMGAEELAKGFAVPYQDNQSAFNAKRPRRPYKDQRLTKETASARKLQACMRCRMQRIRCQPDTNDPSGCCVTCKEVSKQKIHMLPCVRYRLRECTMYLTGNTPGLDHTCRWPEMKLRDISSWADAEIRTINISSDVFLFPLELSVRRFVPIPQDSLHDSWMDGRVKKLKQITPFAIEHMSAAVQKMRDYIDKHVFECIEYCLRNEDAWVQETYKFARQYIKIASLEEGTLLADYFRLWIAIRCEATAHFIVGEDTLDMVPETSDRSYPLFGKVPLPPVMIKQLDIIRTIAFLNPLRKKVLEDFQKIVFGNTSKSWIVIYLITFMSLHSCAVLTNENYQNARRHGLKRRFAMPNSISELHHSANVFLAHYHYCTKLCNPFTVDGNIRHTTSFAEMTTSEIDFLHVASNMAKERKDKFRRLWEHCLYEDDLYFVSQMFEEDWTPRDTIIDYDDGTIYGMSHADGREGE